MSDFEIIDHSNIAKYKHVLSFVSSDSLMHRFQEMDALYYRHTLTEEVIIKALTDLLTVSIEGKSFAYFIRPLTAKNPYVQHPLYRVRRLSYEQIEELVNFRKMNYKTILSFLSVKSDVWARPAECVEEWSRINSPGQAMLYLSSSAQIALKETRCEKDDVFMLLQYRFKRKPTFLYQIHDFQHDPLFSEEENLKLQLIQRFLFNTFSRFIPKEESQYYKIPALLYNHFIRHEDVEAFVYPPVSFCKSPGFNVGIEGNRVDDTLEFAGGSIYINDGPSETELYKLMKKIDFDWVIDSYKFYTPKSGDCYDNRMNVL